MTTYMFRIDDIQPWMNWQNFEKIMDIFSKEKVKVLLGVTPDWKLLGFQGTNFIISKKENYFFKKIKEYQLQGHSIAIHGLEHTILTKNKGKYGLNNYSEFAGLPFVVQLKKIKKGKKILLKQQLQTNWFFAPAHAFDNNTLKAIKRTKIKYVSDGLFLFPEKKGDITLFPQISGQPRKQPIGYATIALHTNNLTTKEFNKLKLFLKENKENIISPIESIHKYEKTNKIKKILFKYVNRISEVMIRIIYLLQLK